MKIVCISDTHLKHDFVIPDGDILVHAGDMTQTGSEFEVTRAAKWLGSQKHRTKIAIAGNHDWLFQQEPERAADIMREHGVSYLQDSLMGTRGITFYGSPWQPWFYDWAFNLQRGFRLKQKWSYIPLGVDVLITHGPPQGILDRVPRGPEGGGHGELIEHTREGVYARVGCRDLMERVVEVKPKIHVFGHIHCGYGKKTVDDTTFVNASICNEEYRAVNEPLVLVI